MRNTSLYYAVENGDDSIARLLLSYGADIDKPDKYSFTPLHQAIQNKHKNIVSLLLMRKASARPRFKSARHR